MSWTTEHETRLAALVAEGKSASQIAAELPQLPATLNKPMRAVTRDMVIGKARRMGLKLGAERSEVDA